MYLRKTKKPIISVIVPAYNEELLIEDCLKSLLNQRTRFPYEIILVDNCSSDNTAAIAKNLGVRVVREPKKGRAFAKNRGVTSSQGDLLAFTDADSQVPVNWIETIVNYFNVNPPVVAVCTNFSLETKSPIYSFLGPASCKLTNFLYSKLFGSIPLRSTGFAVKKSGLKLINGFNPKAAPFDDLDCGFRIGKLGPVIFLDNLVVKTSSRRVQGRFLTFCKEYVVAFSQVFIFKNTGNDDNFPPVRNN